MCKWISSKMDTSNSISVLRACVCCVRVWKRAMVLLSFLFIFISENRCGVLRRVAWLDHHTHTKNANANQCVSKKNPINNKCDKLRSAVALNYTCSIRKYKWKFGHISIMKMTENQYKHEINVISATHSMVCVRFDFC